MILCVRTNDQPGERLIEAVAARAPRIALDQDHIWVDARGLPADALARRIHGLAGQLSCAVRIGVAAVPIVAQAAAAQADAETPLFVARGEERLFLEPLALDVLRLAPHWLELLQGVGIETCGELAVLEREAVEVRFGPDLLAAWQQARAQDERRLFLPVPPEPLHAAIDFIDYVVSDPERLVFSVNAMLCGICDALQSHGSFARRMQLTLALADNTTWERALRPARPTAQRAVWLRLARAVLERITVSDAVRGIVLVVGGTEAASAVQGDLFDAGFATARAVDAALERLLEAQGEVVAEVEPAEHPLAEQRSVWQLAGAVDTGRPPADQLAGEQATGLTLQLLTEPREVLVETIRRRDHNVPVRYRDGLWRQLVTVAGPDRVSGGRWESAYAREYFRAVTVDGLLVWLFRDGRDDRWFLHGWWD